MSVDCTITFAEAGRTMSILVLVLSLRAHEVPRMKILTSLGMSACVTLSVHWSRDTGSLSKSMAWSERMAYFFPGDASGWR